MSDKVFTTSTIGWAAVPGTNVKIRVGGLGVAEALVTDEPPPVFKEALEIGMLRHRVQELEKENADLCARLDAFTEAQYVMGSKGVERLRQLLVYPVAGTRDRHGYHHTIDLPEGVAHVIVCRGEDCEKRGVTQAQATAEVEKTLGKRVVMVFCEHGDEITVLGIDKPVR